MSVTTILARERGDNSDDYNTSKIDGFTFIDTPSHGYLCLGSDDNGYSDALKIARLSNHSYVLDTLVYLEEDCDMSEFLQRGLVNA